MIRQIEQNLLVDPSLLGELVGDKLLWLEPESNLLLSGLNSIGTVADVASDILENTYQS